MSPSTELQLSTLRFSPPEGVNVIVGQSHFIKTVEDVHEALAGTSPHLRFGIAFCEASGARLVRRSGNDDALTDLATTTALDIGVRGRGRDPCRDANANGRLTRRSS